MKIKLLVGRVSAEESLSPGDTITVSDVEAYTLITSGQAEPKVKKEFADLEKRLEEAKAKEAEKQAKIIAIQKEDELKTEANALLDDLVAVITTLESIDESYGETFMKHVASKLGKKGK